MLFSNIIIKIYCYHENIEILGCFWLAPIRWLIYHYQPALTILEDVKAKSWWQYCPLLIQIIAALFPGSGMAASASAVDNNLFNLHKFFTSCWQQPHSLLLLTTGFSLRILVPGERCNIPGEYFQRGSTSE